MQVHLDNIIFSIQPAGGISVYWAEMIRRMVHDNLELTLEESPGASNNLFRQAISIAEGQLILDRRPVILSRFMRAIGAARPGSIFHSSYYRRPRSGRSCEVQTVHDFTYERYLGLARKTVHGIQKRNAVRGASGIICISSSTKDDLLKTYPFVSPDRVTVIHHGYSADFKPIDDDSSRSLARTMGFDGRPYCIFVGKRCHHKNFWSAVEAIAPSTDMSLLLVGGPPLSKAETDRLNTRLPNRWQHRRQAPPQLLNAAYGLAHALIYPSSYEGFGLPVIEAMAAGCPVIAVRASSIPEVAGDAGLLVDEPDPRSIAVQVERLRCPDVRQSTRAAGLSNAGRFSWDRCYQQTIAFYRSTLER